MDPLFNNNYSLQENSPCIDSGNPNLLDPGQVATAMIETSKESETGRAFIVKADHDPRRKQYQFTQVEGFPV